MNPASSPWRAFRNAVVVAFVVATLFTAGTPHSVASLAQGAPSAPRTTPTAPLPTPTPRPRPRIGIVAGHWKNDSGAVCPDGLQEADVNLNIAQRVADMLQAQGFDVDLLAEFDPRLSFYQALALISIHADSCAEPAERTGFKIAVSTREETRSRAQRLKACLTDRYGRITGLPLDPHTVTDNMERYHAFDEIHYATVAAIIETGFLNGDRGLLTRSPDVVAQGIVAGIECFVYNEPIVPRQTETP